MPANWFRWYGYPPFREGVPPRGVWRLRAGARAAGASRIPEPRMGIGGPAPPGRRFVGELRGRSTPLFSPSLKKEIRDGLRSCGE